MDEPEDLAEREVVVFEDPVQKPSGLLLSPDHHRHVTMLGSLKLHGRLHAGALIDGYTKENIQVRGAVGIITRGGSCTHPHHPPTRPGGSGSVYTVKDMNTTT